MEDSNRKFLMTAANLKSTLRLQTKELLKSLPWKRRQAASYLAVMKLKEKLKPCKQVLSFTSFGTEIDLWPLNAILAK
jgi:5-formyltetrahydrofolate cyclo-ligase